MKHKSTIIEKEACEIFYKELHNASEAAVDKLKELFPDALKNLDINRAKMLYFYAEIYCAMLTVREFFNFKQAERIKDLIANSLATSEDFYNIMKEIEWAYLEWDESLYRSTPEHPFENIARYLYLKWRIPTQRMMFGTNKIEKPNLAIVYTIESSLIVASGTWKYIIEHYAIIEESSKN